MCNRIPTNRPGITLMEVLISIGILAIGLTSVVSLIPAGRSEASKAVVYDRAASIAMNAMSDAITYGLTRPDSFVVASGSAATVVFDPANVIPWPAPATTTGTLKSAGVLSPTSAAAMADLAVERLLMQGRDDVVVNPPATADDLPTNAFLNGIRGFDGRTTSLVAVTEADSSTPPLVAGDMATLSVVVFRNRDLANSYVNGTMDSAGKVTLSPPPDRTLKSIMQPGVVLYYVDSNPTRLRFAQLSMAAVDTGSNDTYVTFSGRPIPMPTPPKTTVDVTILVDSVGLAERTVTLEGPGPFGQ